MTREIKQSPLDKRESALAEIAQRLGAARKGDERFNNGFAHHSVAVLSAYVRAQEKRLAIFVERNNVTIREAVPIKAENEKVAKQLIGKTVLVNRPLFENTMTLTEWIMNFYQESPSINKVAREDQVEIATKGFAVPVIMSPQTSMEEDE